MIDGLQVTDMTKAASSQLPTPVAPQTGRHGEKGGSRPFDWATLVAQTVHPVKVAIIEALQWVDQPLSATKLTAMLEDDAYALDDISYHLRGLLKLGSIEVVDSRQGRGAPERFYVLTEADQDRR